MKIVAALVALAPAFVLHGAEIDLGFDRKLSFEPPPQWSVKTNLARNYEGGLDYIIRMQPPAGTRGNCMIRLFEEGTEPTKDFVRRRVAEIGAGAAAGRTGSKIGEIQDFSLPDGYGSYVIVTSQKGYARDNGFRAPAFGVVQLGHGIAASVTLFADDPTNDVFRAAISAVNTLRVIAP